MRDDLIKRSDAIGAITNHCENECYYRVDNWCPQCQREEFQEAIKAVPSADRPKGEWIDEANEYDASFGIHDYICSNCNHYADDHIGGHMWYTMYKPNYCPNCGARMKGADDDL